MRNWKDGFFMKEVILFLLGAKAVLTTQHVILTNEKLRKFANIPDIWYNSISFLRGFSHENVFCRTVE